MHVQSFCVNPFQTNCLVCHDGRDAIVIDPGCAGQSERDDVLQYIRDNGLVLRELVLTHGHIDHILDLAFFGDEYGLGYAMHEEDLPLVRAADIQASTFGLSIRTPPEPGRLLRAGDVLTVGEARWEVVHTPGHSPGSISFIDHEGRFVVAGDVLFQGSIGRTDLWRGSMSVLLESINQELFSLPDDFVVYPGHGPPTTIGEERATNPFLR